MRPFRMNAGIVRTIVISALAGIASLSAAAQSRVAVLPIRNMDGNLGLNSYCYSIADSLRSALSASPSHGKDFIVVPSDSIEAVLAELNLDPNSPQYESDLWKSVAILRCDLAVTGSFNTNAGKMLVNVYSYSVATKMPNLAHAAVNIFKAPEKILSMVPVMRDRLVPGLSVK
ncbi:MAG: hypothetical protein ACKOAX_06465 [Candidatus Kapaibacterium sp.]